MENGGVQTPSVIPSGPPMMRGGFRGRGGLGGRGFDRGG